MGELVVFGLVSLAVALLLIARALSGGKPEDPAAVLSERYARGEISEEEYTRRLSILTYGPPIVFPPELPRADEDPR